MRASLILAAACVPAVAEDANNQANPIRKVVTLLQNLQKKVTEEGKKEKELYEKFMCYCKTGNGDAGASIAAAEGKIPSVTSDIEASVQKLAQTKADLKSAQVDRSSAKKAMEEATAIREKEAAVFAAHKAEQDTNIAALNKAVAALEKGMGGAFLQTQAAQVLRNIISKQDSMLEGDRQDVLSFLSGTQSNGYAPASGQIVGIIKEMSATMAKVLGEVTAEEKDALETFAGLIKAKNKEVGALTASIESKTKQVGNLGIQIVQMKSDLSDTEAALAEDQAFLADLEKSCSTKEAEWAERQKTRAVELVALADTIKVLNDDDALELFKSTLPGAGSSASLLQVSNTAMMRSRALEAIKVARKQANSEDHINLDFLMVALSGKKSAGKGQFDKVVKMIDNMVGVLKEEQIDDDNKKEYCGIQLDQTDDKKKTTVRAIEDAEAGIASTTEAIATFKDEIKALEAGIKALDKSVAEATEQRQNENVEFKDLMASNGAAKELLTFAKNRLNKFYNPKMYKAPPKRELTESERIAVNNGGEAPPAEAPGGIAGTGISAFVQISLHSQVARPPPPETFGAYSTKSEGTNGVIAMVNILIADLDKEMTEASTEEKNSQAGYETMMSESAGKRTSDAKSLANKASTLADTEAELQSVKESKEASATELMALSRYIASLHAECDWLMQYHEVRATARSGEIDSLGRAKAVLGGADFAMLQTKSKGFMSK